VGELSDVTAEQVRESQREFRKASDALAPFKRILDVYTSRWFGNDVRATGSGKRRREVDPTVEFLQASESSTWLKNPDKVALTGECKKVSEIAVQESLQRRFFHWELEFPEVFYEKGVKKDRFGFDAVFGNPPYLSIVGMKEEDRNAYAQIFEFYDYRYDIFGLMIERSLKLLNSELSGFGMIVPSVLMNSDSFSMLRKFILDEFTFSSLLYFGDGAFEEAVIPTMVMVLEKRRIKDDLHLIRVMTEILDFDGGRYSPSQIRQQAFLDSWNNTFNINMTVPLERIFLKVRLFSQCIGDMARTNRGIITGNDQKYLDSEKKTSKWKHVVRGENIERYYVSHAGEYVYYGGRDVLHDPSNEDNFLSSEKLFLRRISDRLIASLDASQLYCLDTLYTIVLEGKEHDSRYVLSILNSTILSELYRRMIPIKGRTFPEVRIYDFNRVPMRHIHFTTSKNIRLELLEKGKRLYEKCLSNDDFACVTEFVEHLLPKDEQGDFLAFKEGATGAEEKSDVVHDFLAFLAEEMIRLNKEKQIEMKRYLGWMQKKARLAEGIDSLSGKTIIKNYLGDYQKNEGETLFEEIVKVLQKNKNKLGVTLSQPKLVNELRHEYESSLAKLLPIKHTLAATDRLIDEIVYKLYGLTEEEARIVEGKS